MIKAQLILDLVTEAKFKPNMRLLKTAMNPPKNFKGGYVELNAPDVVEYAGGLNVLKKKFQYVEDAWAYLTSKESELTGKLFKTYSEIGETDATAMYQWVLDNWTDSKGSTSYLFKKYPSFKTDMMLLHKQYVDGGYDKSKEGKAIEKEVLKRVKVQLKKVDSKQDWGDDPFYIQDDILDGKF
jgi:hypothetical protein